MNILIKLKDCNLTEIGSEMSCKTVFDYYGDYETPIQYMSFTFDNNITVYTVINNSDCDFCTVAGFFYGKNFGEMTQDEFIKSFLTEMDAEFISQSTRIKFKDMTDKYDVCM